MPVIHPLCTLWLALGAPADVDTSGTSLVHDARPSSDLTVGQADPLPVHQPEAEDPNRPTVLFVNFDGATLMAGGDDSRINSTQIVECEGEFPAYTKPDRDAIVQGVKHDFAMWNVEVVTERPKYGNYEMAMVGPSDCINGGGIAPVGCGNGNPNSIALVFATRASAAAESTVVSHELGHTFGLEHVEAAAVMNGFSTAENDFYDGCLPISGAQLCASQHEQYCPPDQQNAVAELEELLGPAVVDTEPPVVEIVSPTDAIEIDPGTEFNVLVEEVEAEDDRSVLVVLLYLDGEELEPDDAAPYMWTIDGLEDGRYELTATALDYAGFEAEAEPVTLYIGDVEPPDSDDSGEMGTDSGMESGSMTVGEVQPIDDLQEGCSCAAEPSRAAWWLTFVLAPILRRRNAVMRRGRPRRRRAH